MNDALEAVARSIAIAAFHRRYPKSGAEFISGQADRHWQEYVPDARLVMATIDRLVQAEELQAFCDQTLPKTPDFIAKMNDTLQ